MPSTEERVLVLRSLHGDREAFGEIVHLHQQAVFGVAYRMLGNVHDAEDAAQEAFIRAYRFLDAFEPDRPLGPWLNRITFNVCMNRLETGKQLLDIDEEAASSPEPDPERQAVVRDSKERIRYELDRLPLRYRAAIELRHFQEMSYADIAKQLHRSLADVKSDLFRARKLLAERLRDLK
jgi:RNA polymerase sigma-70 factor (ECF subfamily)